MDQIIKCLLLKNGDIIISQIMEVDTELGGPDCKLIKPFKMVVSVSYTHLTLPTNREV